MVWYLYELLHLNEEYLCISYIHVNVFGNNFRCCGFSIVCVEPIFMAFMGNPCTWIYIPTNLYKIFCLIFIKIIMITPPKKLHPHDEENVGYPWTLTPTIKNDSTVLVLQDMLKVNVFLFFLMKIILFKIKCFRRWWCGVSNWESDCKQSSEWSVWRNC